MTHPADTVEGMHFSTWREVREAVDAITLKPGEQFDEDTVANAVDVLAACEPNTSLPVGVKKGYWPTIVVWWDGFELEVFEDRVEVYIFAAMVERTFGMRSTSLAKHSVLGSPKNLRITRPRLAFSPRSRLSATSTD